MPCSWKMKSLLAFFGVMIASSFVALQPLKAAEDGWDGPHKKHSFPQVFPAGVEKDGTPLYIAQCVHRDTTVTTFMPFYSTKNKGWHIGKAAPHLKDGMSFSWGGKEYDSGHCRHDEFWVFIGVPGKTYSWVGTEGGNYPPNAVGGFNGEEGQIICRGAQEDGREGVHPGKLIPKSKACFIGWGGKEHGHSRYDVLVVN